MASSPTYCESKSRENTSTGNVLGLRTVTVVEMGAEQGRTGPRLARAVENSKSMADALPRMLTVYGAGLLFTRSGRVELKARGALGANTTCTRVECPGSRRPDGGLHANALASFTMAGAPTALPNDQSATMGLGL